jgi:hypothetical protein
MNRRDSTKDEVAVMGGALCPVKWRARLQLILGALFLTILAGAVGYYRGALRESSAARVSFQDVCSLDYFISWKSFSEIDGAKALLQAAAEQIIQAMQTRLVVGIVPVSNVTKEIKAIHFGKAIGTMDREIEYFKGSAQELLLVKELLSLLHREGNYNRWLEVYLKALYEHPTDELVGECADQALHTSKLLERELEVRKAFQHVCDIPFDFEAKQKVLRVDACNNQLAQNTR